jgi:hypothetical protein
MLFREANSAGQWADAAEGLRRAFRTTRRISETSLIHSTGNATFRSFPETKSDYDPQRQRPNPPAYRDRFSGLHDETVLVLLRIKN